MVSGAPVATGARQAARGGALRVQQFAYGMLRANPRPPHDELPATGKAQV
jgi:hypothetical protein